MHIETGRYAIMIQVKPVKIQETRHSLVSTGDALYEDLNILSVGTTLETFPCVGHSVSP
jgi:hypothetical protein